MTLIALSSKEISLYKYDCFDFKVYPVLPFFICYQTELLQI